MVLLSAAPGQSHTPQGTIASCFKGLWSATSLGCFQPRQVTMVSHVMGRFANRNKELFVNQVVGRLPSPSREYFQPLQETIASHDKTIVNHVHTIVNYDINIMLKATRDYSYSHQGILPCQWYNASHVKGTVVSNGLSLSPAASRDHY